MRYLSLLLLAALILLTACAGASQGQSSSRKKEYGYIRLNGSMENREALIDGQPVGSDPEDSATTVRVSTGKHLLQIRSGNWMLLSTDLEVAPGQTLEISVP